MVYPRLDLSLRKPIVVVAAYGFSDDDVRHVLVSFWAISGGGVNKKAAPE
jgi:hypothetical protein